MGPSVGSSGPQLIEPAGGAMWISALVLAHAWAAIFLLRSCALLWPAQWRRLRALVPGVSGARAAPRPLLQRSQRTACFAHPTHPPPAAAWCARRSPPHAQGARAHTRPPPRPPPPPPPPPPRPRAAAPPPKAPAPAHSAAPSKVARLAEPLLLEWEALGCAYSTSDGIKTVLEARGPFGAPRAPARVACPAAAGAPRAAAVAERPPPPARARRT